MVILTEQIEIPASYERLKAWTANFEEEFVKWSPYHIECNLYNGNYNAGSKIRFREIVMGLDYDVTGTITECEQDIRKMGVQFTAGQQGGIAPTAMLLEIVEMPLSPYPDWLIFLRPIIPGDKVVVPDKLIVQACPFVCDDFFHCSVLLMIFCNHCSRRAVRNRMCK